MNQPERLYDTKGVPIYPGDLIRSLHFIGSRRKRHYLYHVVVEADGYFYGVPTSWLAMSESEQRLSGGRFLMDQKYLDTIESTIIDGHGPGLFFDYLDRPKRAKPAAGVSEANS